MLYSGLYCCSCMYTVQLSEPQRVFPSCPTWSQKSSTLDFAVLRSWMLLRHLRRLMSSWRHDINHEHSENFTPLHFTSPQDVIHNHRGKAQGDYAILSKHIRLWVWLLSSFEIVFATAFIGDGIMVLQCTPDSVGCLGLTL